MSNEVDLTLVSNSKPYVDGVKQAMNANQQLQNQIKQGYETEKQAVKEIQRAIAELTIAKQKSTNPKEQELYNQKIKEAKFELKEASNNMKNYKDAIDETDESQKKSEKSQSLLSQGWFKMVGLIGGVMGAWRGFKSIMESTQATADGFAFAMAGLGGALKSVLSDVAALEFNGMMDRMRAAANGAMEHAKVLDDMTDATNAVEIRRAKLSNDLIETQIDMREALNNRDYEGYKEYKEKYLAIASDLASANEKIQESILESYKKNIIGTKIIRQEGTDALRELTAEEIGIITNYIENYDKLMGTELEEIKKFKEFEVKATEEAEKNKDKIVVDKFRGRIAQMQERNEKMKLALEATLNKEKSNMSEMAQNILALEPVLNDMVDADRLAFSQLLKNRYMATNEMSALRKSLLKMDKLAQTQSEMDAKQAADKKAQRIKELGDAILKIEDDNEKKRIERLEGIPRIDAEEKYQLAQIAKTKSYLETLGTLDKNALNAIATLEQNARLEASAKRDQWFQEGKDAREQQAFEEIKAEADKQEKLKAIKQQGADFDLQIALKKADMSDNPEIERATVLYNAKVKEIEDLKRLEKEQLASNDELTRGLAANTAKQIQLAQYEAEEFKKAQAGKKLSAQDYANAFQTAFNTVTGMLQSTYNAQLQFFQRERQMMDTRIGELQRTIDQEIEARDKGYANNVEGKKKELEALQAERDKAFEKEKKIAEAQKNLNEVIQVSNLITASAQLFATYSKIPGGTVLAIGLIALMLGAYVKAKVDAKKYASLGEGGTGTKTGIITGKKHSQGGENFLDHVEVESGETWGVLAANKVPKYGSQFHSIVKAMNEGRFEMRPQFKIPASNNNITVNNDNKRMVSLERAMRDVESAIRNQPQIYYSGGKRIEKKGRNTRIIYEKN